MTGEPYQPIDCGQHDYLEIACMYGYRVSLHMKNGDVVEGVSKTTRTGSDRTEWLVLSLNRQVSEEGTQLDVDIRLDEIRVLNVLTPNARFTQVNFA